MLIINLFGGPGTGKSTTAAGVFSLLKQANGLKCELVTEVAKDLVFEESPLLANSLHVFSEQWRRLDRLRDKVDVVVTDAPLLTTLMYTSGLYERPWFGSMATELHEVEPSLNVFLHRVKPYAAYGRTQTEAEARQLDEDIKNALGPFDADIVADEEAPQKIFVLAKIRLDKQA